MAKLVSTLNALEVLRCDNYGFDDVVVEVSVVDEFGVLASLTPSSYFLSIIVSLSSELINELPPPSMLILAIETLPIESVLWLFALLMPPLLKPDFYVSNLILFTFPGFLTASILTTAVSDAYDIESSPSLRSGISAASAVYILDKAT